MGFGWVSSMNRSSEKALPHSVEFIGHNTHENLDPRAASFGLDERVGNGLHAVGWADQDDSRTSAHD